MRFSINKLRKLLPFSLFLLLNVTLAAQDITLTFKGIDGSGRYTQLDHVVVSNHTKGWSEVIVWPDTTLTMQLVDDKAESDAAKQGLVLTATDPSQFGTTGNVLLTVFEDGEVTLIVSHMNGFTTTRYASTLQPGTYPCSSLSSPIRRARWKDPLPDGTRR